MEKRVVEVDDVRDGQEDSEAVTEEALKVVTVGPLTLPGTEGEDDGRYTAHVFD